MAQITRNSRIAIQLAGWQDESGQRVLHFRLVEAGLALKAQHSGYPQTAKRRDQRRRRSGSFRSCVRACVRAPKFKGDSSKLPPPFAASRGCPAAGRSDLCPGSKNRTHRGDASRKDLHPADPRATEEPATGGRLVVQATKEPAPWILICGALLGLPRF